MKDCYKRGCRAPRSLQEEWGERPRRSEPPRKHCDEEADEMKEGQTDQLIKPDLGLLNKGGLRKQSSFTTVYPVLPRKPVRL